MNMFEVLVSISFNFFSSKLPNTFHHFYPLQSFPGVLVQLCFHHRFHHFLWKWKGVFPLRFTLQHILWGPVFFGGGGLPFLREEVRISFECITQSSSVSTGLSWSGLLQTGLWLYFPVRFCLCVCFAIFPPQNAEIGKCKLYCLSGLMKQRSWSEDLGFRAKLFFPL